MPRLVSATQQIFDNQAGSPQTVTTKQYSGSQVVGTVWPLLFNTVCRIFNVGMTIFPDAPGVLFVQSQSIYVQLLDSQGNNIEPSIILAAANYPASSATANGAELNGTEGGCALSADGDPLIELVSGFLLTNFAAKNGPTAASFQLGSSFECFNNDSSSHTAYCTVNGLLSFAPRT